MAMQIVEPTANFSRGLLYFILSAAFDSILREFLVANNKYDVRVISVEHQR